MKGGCNRTPLGRVRAGWQNAAAAGCRFKFARIFQTFFCAFFIASVVRFCCWGRNSQGKLDQTVLAVFEGCVAAAEGVNYFLLRLLPAYFDPPLIPISGSPSPQHAPLPRPLPLLDYSSHTQDAPLVPCVCLDLNPARSHMLHDRNAAVRAIVAAAGPGLLTIHTQLDAIDSFVARVNQDPAAGSVLKAVFLRVRETLRSLELPPVLRLQLDKKKALLLGHTFPDAFPDALALLTTNGVYIEQWGVPEVSPEKIVEQYLSGQNDNLPVFVRVKMRVEKEEFQLPGGDLLARLDQLLRPLGYTYNALKQELQLLENKQQTESEFSCTVRLRYSLPRDWHAHVDPYTWFCSCSTYSKTVGPEQLIERFQAASKIIDTDKPHTPIDCFLQRGAAHLSLPVCQHLLAVLLAILNWELVRAQGLISCTVVTGGELLETDTGGID